ncbi:hypothetical protein U8335_05300 [Roseiconus lacunae]|uniref:hypothetical protein n=1 Tax=Roseiconus lacunae TaxID=2605694 RepID=UPI00308642E0|nr:hypothetical protein U8335_05300 [Stieleria sp. HD01]
MTICRLTTQLAATFIAVSAFGCLGNEAQAGCLDWLFGRSPVYTANYPYAPVSAPMGIVPGGSQAVTMPGYSQSFQPSVPAASSGVIAAQRPAYAAGSIYQGNALYQSNAVYQGGTTAVQSYTPVQSFNNPSVYTGLPVDSSAATSYRLPIGSPANVTPYQASRVPISQTLRGTANPILPSNSYTASYGSVAPTSYAAPALSTVPTTVPLAYEPRRWRLGSGLARFFNSLLGRNTDYVTSYYRAPVTYYRPVTTVDPITGTTSTVQQSCSSYVQQLQRVPYNTLMPSTIPPTQIQTLGPSPLDPCATPYAANPLGSSYTQTNVLPPTSTPGTFSTPSTINQVGGESIPGVSGVSPIPTTIPPNQYSQGQFPQGSNLNVSPLTGQSSAPGTDPADQQDTGQPQLEAQRPAPESQPQSAPLQDDYQNPYDDYYRYNGRGDSNGNAPLTEPDTNQADPAGPSPNDGESGIQLDPPVTGRMRGSSPDGLFRSGDRITAQTPPSLSGQATSGQTPAPIAPTYSSVRPIGVPPTSQPPQSASDSMNSVPPFTQTPTGYTGQRGGSIEQPPMLPPPSKNYDDRFQTNSTGTRTPVREVKLRETAVRQVAAWEELDPLPRIDHRRANETAQRAMTIDRASGTQQPTMTQPAPRKQRSSAGWLPAN